MAHPRYLPFVEATRRAAKTHGVISRAQAVEAGLSTDAIDRLLRRGSWRRVLPGVYVLWAPAKGRDTWIQRVTAGALWIGGDSAVSHRAAAQLVELDGIVGAPIELSTTGRGRSTKPGIIVHRIQMFHPSDVGTSHGIRVTSLARTIVDLASVVDGGRLESAMESALRGRLNIGDLEAALGRAPRNHRGRMKLQKLVDGYSSGRSESALEVLVWRLLRNAKLPMPARQHVVRADARIVARVDFAYPSARIAIEADGFTFHRTAKDLRYDRSRQNALVKLGWVVYRVTWEDAERHPRQVAADVRGLLDLRTRER